MDQKQKICSTYLRFTISDFKFIFHISTGNIMEVIINNNCTICKVSHNQIGKVEHQRKL